MYGFEGDVMLQFDLKRKKDFIQNWNSTENITKFESFSVAYLAAYKMIEDPLVGKCGAIFGTVLLFEQTMPNQSGN